MYIDTFVIILFIYFIFSLLHTNNMAKVFFLNNNKKDGRLCNRVRMPKRTMEFMLIGLPQLQHYNYLKKKLKLCDR